MQPYPKYYKALNYVVLILAAVFAFMDVIFLVTALANPAALIFVFVIACFVLYSIASFKFFRNTILNNQVQTKKSKDWLKVNAYVSIFLCSLFFLNSISVLMSSNEVLIKVTEEFLEQQPGLPAGITSALMLDLIKAVSYFLLVTGLVGLMHIRITLRLLKQKDQVFE